MTLFQTNKQCTPTIGSSLIFLCPFLSDLLDYGKGLFNGTFGNNSLTRIPVVIYVEEYERRIRKNPDSVFL